MISIETNKHDIDYLLIKRADLMDLVTNRSVIEDIRKSARNFYCHLLSFEKENNVPFISEISIRKDSEIGDYLLQTADIEVINEDNNISYKKVVGAFNIAVFEDNPISLELLSLFKGKVSGKRDELLNKYGEKVVDYILSNPDFNSYLVKEEDYEEYVVYDDNQCSIRKPIAFQKVKAIEKSRI